MARFEVDVILVVPGLTKTGLRDNMPRSEGKAQIDFAGGMDSKDVAQRIVAGIEPRQARGRHRLGRQVDAAHRWFRACSTT